MEQQEHKRLKVNKELSDLMIEAENGVDNGANNLKTNNRLLKDRVHEPNGMSLTNKFLIGTALTASIMYLSYQLAVKPYIIEPVSTYMHQHSADNIYNSSFDNK